MRVTLNLNVWRYCAIATVAAAVIAAAAPAVAANPAYVGTWAQTQSECRRDGIQIEVKRRSILDQDAECRLSSVVGGKGQWQARAKCFGEASPARTPVTITLWATASRLTLRYSSYPKNYNYLRCH
jgi:hypothetical protein